MPKKPSPSTINQTAIGDGNIQIVGDKNVVNQTIIQRISNFFTGDKETVDQRNRRIMLGHVENFWVKGILEKSLHGAALLELGIKEDPDALNYPWAIKREANKETLPAGTSMLEIFQEIGLGRSLLILGAPGSGKTTMLLELARKLIERAREDVTEPVPVVFNLSSWTEKLTLADWLARELNVIYTIPKKIAPTWVKENKMLLLLDGFDEVRQGSRDKCVDAINNFRKEYGLTNIAVCSRSQDYADLKGKLSFDGAIEIQPLTSNQVDDYFIYFGEGLAGVRQVLVKDTVLREMAETPLFLSIMTLAYRNTKSADILVSENLDLQRQYLFDTYIERMFTRPGRSKKELLEKQDVSRWLSWLASKMVKHVQIPYLIERMQPNWLDDKEQSKNYWKVIRLIVAIFTAVCVAWFNLLAFWATGLGQPFEFHTWLLAGIFGLGAALGMMLDFKLDEIIITVDTLTLNFKKLFIGLSVGMGMGLMLGYITGPNAVLSYTLGGGLGCGLLLGLEVKEAIQIKRPGERLFLSLKNFLFTFLGVGLLGWLFGMLVIRPLVGLIVGLFAGLLLGGTRYGGSSIAKHYALRFFIAKNHLLPWELICFLNYCVDLIFLRRVGGGYIFVHRLLMEHFADMYPTDEK